MFYNVISLGEVGKSKPELLNLKPIMKVQNQHQIKPETQSCQTSVVRSLFKGIVIKIYIGTLVFTHKDNGFITSVHIVKKDKKIKI